jgi:acyl-CoA reductase-like NAD-dependent aldehyde dehydrogenase
MLRENGVATTDMGRTPHRTSGVAMASALIAHEAELIDVLVGIATHRSAVDEFHRSISALVGAPWELARNDPRPLERLAVFLPSNNVLYSYVLFGLVPALFCDEIVIRPSARIKSTAFAIHEILGEEIAGVVSADLELSAASQRAFTATCKESEAIVFTGQYENGREVRAAVGEDPVFLLFGSGPNPFVVGPQTDIETTVRHALDSRLYNSGQDCLCSDVFFVHTSVIDRWLRALETALAGIEVSERRDPEAVVAPLVYADAVEAAAEFIDGNRAAVVHGGATDVEHGHVEPTVLLYPEGADVHPPELFSPIFCVVPYGEAEQVRDWICSPAEIERGMYAIVFGEPQLGQRTVIGTTLVSNDRIALDIEDGNRPFGGYGVRASSAGHGGEMVGRPLLLSAEVGALRGRRNG